MTYPPPPPDRMHLQYQPAPVPQQTQQTGPGGAYGPVRHSPGQPVPGQLPPPSMMMSKPGTVTGIQVILWILLALSAVGNLFSVVSMVNLFNPLQLLILAFTVYSTAQALISPVQIARGKRWAWIWSLVSAILGLAMSAVAIVFGVVMIDFAVYTLLIGIALAGLYGTFLGLLCSKSARQWILMHRIQRGEVQLPGAAAGFGAAGTAQAGAAPQRPETRPGAVNVALVLLGLLVLATAWALYVDVMTLIALSDAGVPMGAEYIAMGHGPFMIMLHLFTLGPLLVCALIVMFGLGKGRFGARVFTIVWTSVLVVAWGFLASGQFVDYLRFVDTVPPPIRTSWTVGVARSVAIVVLLIAVFIAVLLPGVRAWTPGKGSSALIVVVPAAQQPGPYGQPQPTPYAPQQQPPYPPQH